MAEAAELAGTGNDKLMQLDAPAAAAVAAATPVDLQEQAPAEAAAAAADGSQGEGGAASDSGGSFVGYSGSYTSDSCSSGSDGGEAEEGAGPAVPPSPLCTADELVLARQEEREALLAQRCTQSPSGESMWRLPVCLPGTRTLPGA
jgi:hypothetical protein